MHIFNPSGFSLSVFSVALIATGTTYLTWGPEIASTLSLAPHIYETDDSGIDFIVRGEGDLTFRELLRALEVSGDVSGIAGLSWRRGSGFVRNAARAVSPLAAPASGW